MQTPEEYVADVTTALQTPHTLVISLFMSPAPGHAKENCPGVIELRLISNTDKTNLICEALDRALQATMQTLLEEAKVTTTFRTKPAPSEPLLWNPEEARDA